MKVLWAGAFAAAILTGGASAETRYDRSIEHAAKTIVAQKIGDIRGGFSFDAKPMFVAERLDMIKTGSIAAPSPTTSSGPWRDGLAPAIDRKLSRKFF
jgi:hypothetical protein